MSPFPNQHEAPAVTTPFSILQKQIDFILEIDKLKSVLRKTKPVGLDRYENSAEHSWQVALLALTMAEHAPVKLDLDKVIRMLLIHDLGEIDTGDVIVYAATDNAEREAEELAAMRRICGLLPEQQAAGLVELWQEFEARQSAEARFARAMDRLMPILLNLNRQGQSWLENGVSKQQVVSMAASKVSDGCPLAGEWLLQALDRAEAQGFFGA
ncbi:phosphohydrolase [Aquitalea magnusonii]|nr:phosphohydrolase [Aquitalea magnusonii]